MKITRSNKKGGKMLYRSSITLLITIILMTMIPLSATSGQSRSNGMPDYAGPLTVNDHYLIITQESATELSIEELIWFKNDGDENFTGHVFVWSQPNDIMARIVQFGYMVNETFIGAKVRPSSHSPNFLFGNLSEENLTVKPGESIQVVYQYDLKYTSEDEYDFHKTFLYDNTNVILLVEPFGDYNVVGKDNINLIFDENSKKYITSHSDSASRDLGDYISITFEQAGEPDEEPDDSGSEDENSNFLFAVIIIIVLIVIAFAATISKRKSRSKK